MEYLKAMLAEINVNIKSIQEERRDNHEDVMAILRSDRGGMKAYPEKMSQIRKRESPDQIIGGPYGRGSSEIFGYMEAAAQGRLQGDAES
jgi:hypothetical protein